MKDHFIVFLVMISAILAAGALLNLATQVPQLKPGADFITKGYGAV